MLAQVCSNAKQHCYDLLCFQFESVVKRAKALFHVQQYFLTSAHQQPEPTFQEGCGSLQTMDSRLTHIRLFSYGTIRMGTLMNHFEGNMTNIFQKTSTFTPTQPLFCSVPGLTDLPGKLRLVSLHPINTFFS